MLGYKRVFDIDIERCPRRGGRLKITGLSHLPSLALLPLALSFGDSACEGAAARSGLQIRSAASNLRGMFLRLARDRLNALAAQFPAVIILGARQVGKTTLARHSFPDLPYLDCEDPLTAAALRDDARFVIASREKRGLIIDEAQSVGGVLAAVRGLIDEQRARNGRFVILGSAQPALVGGVAESLSGRVARAGFADLVHGTP